MVGFLPACMFGAGGQALAMAAAAEGGGAHVDLNSLRTAVSQNMADLEAKHTLATALLANSEYEVRTLSSVRRQWQWHLAFTCMPIFRDANIISSALIWYPGVCS